MKKTFVKTTLALGMTLALASPVQAFAAAPDCNNNLQQYFNNDCNNIYTQYAPTNWNQNAVKGSRSNTAQLQDLLQQCYPSVGGNNSQWGNNGNWQNNWCDTDNDWKSNCEQPTRPGTTNPGTEKPGTSKPETEKPGTSGGSNQGNLGAYQQQVVELVNKERAAVGLPALKVNTKLASVAEKKAEDMRDRNYFSHTSPTYGSPFDMMKQFGVTYTSAGENIAKGQKSPQSVMNGWMNSQGHKDNILNSSYTEIGVGYVTDSNGNTYWVQMFLRP